VRERRFIDIALIVGLIIFTGANVLILAQVARYVLAPGESIEIACATSVPCPTCSPLQTPEPTATRTNTPEPTSTNTNTPEPTATSTATPMPTNTPQPQAGKPFGPFDWIPSSDWPFTASRLNNSTTYLQLARDNGVQAFVAVGGHSSMSDSSGNFSIDAWKARFDAISNGLQPFVDDGTIIAFYGVDEPHDWDGGTGPTLAQIDAMAEYAHQVLPGCKLVVNAPPSWLLGYDYQYLDAVFTQTNYLRTPDVAAWQAWAADVAATAQQLGLPYHLSINIATGTPSAALVRDTAIALCRTDALSVMMWKFSYMDASWLPYTQEVAEVCGGE